MYRLNVKKFGFALGLTVSLIYLGCMIVMATAGHGRATIRSIFWYCAKLHFRLVDWSVYCGIL